MPKKSRVNQFGESCIDLLDVGGDVLRVGLGAAGKVLGKGIGAARYAIFKAVEYSEDKKE